MNTPLTDTTQRTTGDTTGGPFYGSATGCQGHVPCTRNKLPKEKSKKSANQSRELRFEDFRASKMTRIVYWQLPTFRKIMVPPSSGSCKCTSNLNVSGPVVRL